MQDRYFRPLQEEIRSHPGHRAITHSRSHGQANWEMTLRWRTYLMQGGLSKLMEDYPPAFQNMRKTLCSSQRDESRPLTFPIKPLLEAAFASD